MIPAKNWLVIASVVVFSTFLVWIPLGLHKVFANFDGPYYVVIAQSWYNKATIGKIFSFPLPLEYYAAHFPVFPFLIRFFSPIGYLPATLGINLIATVVCAIVLYEIVRINKWGDPLVVSLVWLFWWPRIWAVRSIGSPETLFILFILASLYFFQKQKYWLAAIGGGLAVLTKSPGILLFPAFLLAAKFNKKIWPTLLIPLSLLLLFTFYFYRTGDFWAYFHSGDNIHLQIIPFQVFESDQPWVGTFWLEDIIWIYVVGGLGIYYMFKKNRVWGWFGVIFYSTILFVSHRDISRYALPLAPLTLIGLSDLLQKKEVRWALVFSIVPIYFYTLNFLLHNTVPIADWTPFISP